MKLTKTLTAGIMAAGLALGLATPANAAGSSTATQSCGGQTVTVSMYSGGGKAYTNRNSFNCTGKVRVNATYKRPGVGGLYSTGWKESPGIGVETQPGNVTSASHEVRAANGTLLISRTT